MNFIRDYRLLLLGGAFLLLAVLSSGGGKGSKASIESPGPTFAPAQAVTAAPSSQEAVQEAPLRKPTPQHVQEEPVRAASPEETLRTDAGEDTTKDAEEEFDPAVAREEAAERVKDFNSELASVLRTINPNAQKTRLKAFQLGQEAENLDRWIESQDSKTGMTERERREWEAQREVWVNQSKSLKRIAKRLSATRGTKRKVRILAKEIAESIED